MNLKMKNEQTEKDKMLLSEYRKKIISDFILYDTNLLAKVYHSSNLNLSIERMKLAVHECKEKAPHRKDFIETTETTVWTMGELSIWIETLWRKMEILNLQNDQLQSACLKLLSDKNKFQAEAEKLLKTLEFSEKP